MSTPTDLSRHPLTDETVPPTWRSLVEYHTVRLASEDVPADQVRVQAIRFVDDFYRDVAERTNELVGPWHYRGSEDGRNACGRGRAEGGGVQKWTADLSMITCDGCRAEVELMLTRAGSEVAAANPQEATEAIRRVAERYMVDVLGVPVWATPTGTAGTPLHAFACEVRALVQRRFRRLNALAVALDNQRGHAERARAVIDDGKTPSWTTMDPEVGVELAATAEAVRTLDSVVAEMAAALVVTCSRVDRWLKAEAPSMTGDVDALDAVMSAAQTWRDVRRVPVRNRVGSQVDRELTAAVDAYRRTLTPTVTDVQP